MFQAQRGRSPIIQIEAFLPHMRGKLFFCPKSIQDLDHMHLTFAIATHWRSFGLIGF